MDMCGMGKRIHGLVRDWISYNICLCRRAALITTGLTIPHYFAKYAVASILITYFTDSLDGKHLKDAVSLTVALDVLSTIFGLVLKYVSEEHVSPLIIVISASLTYIAGLVMLFFSTVYPETISVGYFVGVVFLLAVGIGGGEPITKSILVNQLGAHEPLRGPPDEERKEARSEVWGRSASILGGVLAAKVLGSVEDWKPVFISSASVLGVGISIFSCAIPLLHRSSTIVHPLEEPSNINEWKDIWKMIPICIPFVLFGLVMSAGNTYYLEQATTTGVSVNVLIILQKVCKYGSFYLFDADLMKNLNLLPPKRFLIVRIGFGLVVCLICCVVAFHFVVRTNLHLYYVEYCGPDDYDISMSNNSRLIPQFCLLGLMEGICQGGLEQFFKLQVRKSMKVYGGVTSELVTVIGSVLNGILVQTTGWFGKTLTCSLLDRYYKLLIVLSASNIFLYLFCSAPYWKNWEEVGDNDPATQGDGEGEGETSAAQGEGETSATEGDGEGEWETSTTQGGGEGEGETSAAQGDGEGEGETSATQGDGEGEGETSATQGDGEGEGETLATQADGEGEEAATQGDGEGEGETSATQEDGEGEGETSATQGDGEAKEGEGETLATQGDGEGKGETPL